MKIEEYKKDSNEFYKIASDLVKQFAFAGIGIIWLLNGETLKTNFNCRVIIPLLLMVVTLVFHFLQYFIPSITWTKFYRYHEKMNNGNTDVEVKPSKWLFAPLPAFFLLKTLTLTMGYVYIVSLILNKV